MAGGSDPRAGERDVYTRLRLDRYLLDRGLPRHVWVLVERDGKKFMRPGVLVEWETRNGAWFGQVAWGDDRRLVIEWIPGERLRPISGTAAEPADG